MKKHALTVLGLSFALVGALTLASCQGGAFGGKPEITVLNYADATAPGYAAEQQVWDLVKAKVKAPMDEPSPLTSLSK